MPTAGILEPTIPSGKQKQTENQNEENTVAGNIGIQEPKQAVKPTKEKKRYKQFKKFEPWFQNRNRCSSFCWVYRTSDRSFHFNEKEIQFQ